MTLLKSLLKGSFPLLLSELNGSLLFLFLFFLLFGLFLFFFLLSSRLLPRLNDLLSLLSSGRLGILGGVFGLDTEFSEGAFKFFIFELLLFLLAELLYGF